MSADSRLLDVRLRRAALALHRVVMRDPGPGPLHRVLRRFERGGLFGVPGALVRVPDAALRQALVRDGYIRSLGQAA